MSFADKLKELLNKNGLKAADLARSTGLSEAAISDYLNGKKEPRGRQSIAIAKVLNVSLDTLWETGWEDKMTLGEKIKLARKAQNLTQHQLADMVGAKHNSVSDWENNKSKPDMDTIELLCGALELTPTYLVGNKSDDEYADIIGKLMNEPGLLDMISDYKSLSLEDKKAIRQIISSLKNGRG